MLSPGLSHQVLTEVLRTYAFVKLKRYMVNQLQNSKCGCYRHANSRTPHLPPPRSARLPWVASPGHGLKLATPRQRAAQDLHHC